MNIIPKTIVCAAILFGSINICHADSPALEQAYQLALSGKLQASDNIYQELLNTGQAMPYEVYLSKCLVDVARLDIPGSDKFFDLAVNALGNHPDKEAILLEFNYRRAALFINKGESGKAILILAPYVFQKNASVRMQSDYLDAQFRTGNYSQVVKDAQILWANNYINKPVYGLMPIADSLFKLKKYAQAIPVYEIILKQYPDNFFASLSLAYSLAMCNQSEAALRLYEKCSTLNPSADEIILNEANILFSRGKRAFAKKLYKQLESRSKLDLDKILISKALTFSTANYLLDADTALASVSDKTNAEYLKQSFDNNMSRELYHSADNLLKQMTATPFYNVSKLERQAARKGGIGTAFSTTSNYKGNSIQSYRLDGDVYLGLNTYLLGIIENSRFSDEVNTASVTTRSVGLKHHFKRGQVQAMVSSALAGTSHFLYDLGLSYKLNDLTSIGLGTGKRPVGYAQAILNDFIFEKYYTLSLAHKLNERHGFVLDYGRASLSDNNSLAEYGLSYSYFPTQTERKTHEFFTYYRRSGFSQRSEFYESPDKRLAYGFGWQGRWVLKNQSSWLVRTTFELGHDDLEPTDLSPSIRIQYNYPLTATQELSAAVEYGVRTNRLNSLGNQLVHGYKQFELGYNLSF